MSEVVALFDRRAEAERAVDALFAAGYDADRLGYADRQRDARGEIVTNDTFDTNDPLDDTYADSASGTAAEEAGKGAAGGAIGGAAVGAGAGLLASAGMLLIPGIGPFLAAGTLAGTLGATAAGAAGGAVIGGAAGAIFGASTDDETSTYYREGVDRGGSLVSVDVMDGSEADVVSLLHGAGAKKVDVYGGTDWVV